MMKCVVNVRSWLAVGCAMTWVACSGTSAKLSRAMADFHGNRAGIICLAESEVEPVICMRLPRAQSCSVLSTALWQEDNIDTLAFEVDHCPETEVVSQCRVEGEDSAYWVYEAYKGRIGQGRVEQDCREAGGQLEGFGEYDGYGTDGSRQHQHEVVGEGGDVYEGGELWQQPSPAVCGYRAAGILLLCGNVLCQDGAVDPAAGLTREVLTQCPEGNVSGSCLYKDNYVHYYNVPPEYRAELMAGCHDEGAIWRQY